MVSGEREGRYAHDLDERVELLDGVAGLNEPVSTRGRKQVSPCSMLLALVGSTQAITIDVSLCPSASIEALVMPSESGNRERCLSHLQDERKGRRRTPPPPCSASTVSATSSEEEETLRRTT